MKQYTVEAIYDSYAVVKFYVNGKFESEARIRYDFLAGVENVLEALGYKRIKKSS